MKSAIWLLAFFAFGQALCVQEKTACQDDPLYQMMNFWVGTWQVYDEEGKLVGNNRIEKILDQCAVMEHWQSAEGNEGKSLFYVDNNTGTWKQIWVTANAKLPGGQKEKTLIFSKEKEQLLFQGTYLMNDEKVLDRTLLTRINANEVKQEIQISRDGGLHWQSTFIGIYKRN